MELWGEHAPFQEKARWSVGVAQGWPTAKLEHLRGRAEILLGRGVGFGVTVSLG